MKNGKKLRIVKKKEALIEKLILKIMRNKKRKR